MAAHPSLAVALLVALAALGALGPLAAPAHAARGQVTMLEDTRLLLRGGADTRGRALDELGRLGVEVVKVRVQWRELAPAPSSEVRPTFDARDPAAYPAVAWEPLDAVVREATARGLRPFLMLSPPAPEWATERGELSGHSGVRKPDPADFSRWVEAVGRRYSGTYGGLPAVGLWSIWNEPNHPQFLQPLSERLGGELAPSSPHRYRRLYVAAQRSLARTGHARDTVLFGEILPVGQSGFGPTRLIRPIRFLREFFCLDDAYRPYRGRPAAVRGCARFPRIRTSGFAYHAYTKPGGPRVALSHPDDATIGQIHRVERALDRIARTRRVRRALPIWNTEFGLQTDPPDCVGFGTTLSRQAAFLNEAEYVSFRRPRLKSYSNYLLVDDPVLKRFAPGSNARYRGYQSGLRFGEEASRCDSPGKIFPVGTPKQPSYDAFRTPLYVRRASARRVEVWGWARPRGRQSQAVEVLEGSRVVRTVTARGPFLVSLATRTRGPWQLRWSHEGQTFVSRRARALPDPRPRSL
jgi:hypothetical protein